MSVQSGFQTIWAYVVKDEYRDEFVEAYKSNGSWAELFRKCKGYSNTELMRDKDQPNRYITIDNWTSHAAFEGMKNTIKDEYSALDRRCEAFTLSEAHIGDFSKV